MEDLCYLLLKEIFVRRLFSFKFRLSFFDKGGGAFFHISCIKAIAELQPLGLKTVYGGIKGSIDTVDQFTDGKRRLALYLQKDLSARIY